MVILLFLLGRYEVCVVFYVILLIDFRCIFCVFLLLLIILMLCFFVCFGFWKILLVIMRRKLFWEKWDGERCIIKWWKKFLGFYFYKDLFFIIIFYCCWSSCWWGNFDFFLIFYLVVSLFCLGCWVLSLIFLKFFVFEFWSCGNREELVSFFFLELVGVWLGRICGG